MAKKERSGLGKGLGALLPAATTENVSRETNSVTHPLDSLMPARTNGAGKSGEHADVTKKLLTPDLSKRRRKTRSTNAVKDAAAQPSTPVSDASGSKSVQPPSASGAAASESGGVNMANKEARKVEDTGAQKADKGAGKAQKRPLFADIIPSDQDDRQTETVAASATQVRERSVTSADAAGPDLVSVPGARFANIAVSAVAPNRRQPRSVFDEDELAELADSIREIGVLQPIVVRPLSAADGKEYLQELSKRLDPDSIAELGLRTDDGNWYELVMGERRLRASKLAGLETVPAIVRSTADTDMLRDALLENLHRSQLNPIEEAAAYQQLMEDFACTQQQLSERIARSRSQIANTIRLLKLPASVQRKLAAGVISAGHARALLSLDRVAKMGILADRIVAEGLSVRATEEIVALGEVSEPTAGRRTATHIAQPSSETAKMVSDRLEDLFETRVRIVEGKRKGRIIIEFAGEQDLDRMAALVSILKAGN